MLSRKADYGVRAMVDIAQQSSTMRVVVSDIARRQNIPAFYLAKIMPRLAHAGLVLTSLGASGGVILALPPDQISLLQVIQAVDGPFALNVCSSDPGQCQFEAACPTCETWRAAQTQLNDLLSHTRISDLVARQMKQAASD